MNCDKVPRERPVSGLGMSGLCVRTYGKTEARRGGYTAADFRTLVGAPADLGRALALVVAPAVFVAGFLLTAALPVEGTFLFLSCRACPNQQDQSLAVEYWHERVDNRQDGLGGTGLLTATFF